MQQMVWNGCTEWNENPVKDWPTSTSYTQASEGKKEQTQTTEGLGTYLLKSLSDFLADSLV